MRPVAALLALLSPRALLKRVAGIFPPNVRGLARLLGVLLVLVNLKSLPMLWHARFYSALYHHLLRNRDRYPTSAHLFAPISTLSRPSLYECDVNMHKSNSTYFSDLDINRTHLIAHLIKKSLQLRKARNERPMYVALAGVTALFRREIKPFEKYEMRSRVLSWDGKWLFVVSHFVKCGGTGRKDEDMSKRIYASCLSKYVCKMGRKTVPPEEVLTESGLLPPRPEGDGSGISTPQLHVPGGVAATSTPELVSISGGALSAATAAGRRYDDVLDRVLEKSLLVNNGGGKEEGTTGGWTWQRIEKERRRGMEIARAMLNLDRLDGEVRDVESWGKMDG
ncbi:hypothetical protein DFH27DRAFT_482585 [Peziza echinospora]|nr:hypothetical protein DFH27DRAFT_482585 [Peziza echinospora]